MKQLYINNKRGAIFNLLTSLYVFLYFSFTSVGTNIYLIPWYLSMLVLSLIRWMVANKAAEQFELKDLEKWFNWFFLIILMNGILWSMLYTLFYQNMNDFQRLVTILIMFGGATIAILSLGPSRRCYFAFALPVTVPVILMHWPQYSIDYSFFNAGLLIYLLFTFYLYLHHHNSMVKRFSMMIRQRNLISDLRAMNVELEKASITDSLTGLSNRGYLSERLAKDWARCKRAQIPIALMIIDIDYFKEYNDTYGHLKGDECLRVIASVLKETVTRETDFASRFGGDEMAIVMYNTDAQGATKIANQIIDRIRHLELTHENSPKGAVSVSIGAAVTVPRIDRSEEYLLMMADRALYKVKENGRDGLQFHSFSVLSE